MDVAVAAGDVDIVSVDSMAVYRRMDIATAKPSTTDQALVPHHLIDLLEPWEECTMSLFQAAARSAMVGVEEQSRISLLVGGTGLYHRAVIDDLEIPGRYPEVRASLEAALVDELALARLYEHLTELDPDAAGRIEPCNERRIIRALEVTLGSGRPFSSFGPGLETYPPSEITQIGLLLESQVVDEAIERRVDGWLEEGLLDEVQRLLDDPRGLSMTARQAIGYREVASYLGGSCGLREAREAIVARTRAFARRQRAWFRRDPRVLWCEPDSIRGQLEAALAGIRLAGEVED